LELPATEASEEVPPGKTPQPATLPTNTAEPTVLPTEKPEAPEVQLTEATVSSVTDGDTINVILAGKKYPIRLIGIDTPETKDPRKPVMCFGAEATAKTQELVDRAGGRVLLEKDVSEVDKYNRLLRYVWLDHPDGRRMLNLELVEGGYAQSSSYPPDVKYQDMFVQAMREAREANIGLWDACSGFGVAVTPPTPTKVEVVQSFPPTKVPASGGTSSAANWQAQGLPYDPFGPDRDCGAFSTHAEAQRFFEAAGGPASDRHRLDGDHDGVACESLP
jgi:micrococcal nuclease